MPYYFKFYDRQEDDDPKFSCRLQAERCSGRTKAGNQCSQSSVIGTPWCWTHLLAVKHLRIKDSTVAGAGKGLFALDKSRPTGEIMFRPGQDIIEYGGELIGKREADRRYGNKTAPYGLDVSAANVRDAACERGVGSLANRPPRGTAANARLSANARTQTGKLVATKVIRNGGEIFVAYGSAYNFNEGARHSTSGGR